MLLIKQEERNQGKKNNQKKGNNVSQKCIGKADIKTKAKENKDGFCNSMIGTCPSRSWDYYTSALMLIRIKPNLKFTGIPISCIPRVKNPIYEVSA